jgi:hypothetical protein
MAGPTLKSSPCACDMGRHKRPTRVGFRKSTGCKVAHNQIEIEVKRLGSSKEYTIYISVCKKDTLQRIANLHLP